MKKTALAITAILCTLGLYANKPDYGYLFSYVNGRGIVFAYSSDSLHWTSIGNGRTFVDSDFGTCGAQKKMFTPHLMRDSQGMWRCVWSPKAEQMLADLGTPQYQCGESSVAFLRHATGHHPAGSEIDASIIYADYYYIEALLRMKKLQK